MSNLINYIYNDILDHEIILEIDKIKIGGIKKRLINELKDLKKNNSYISVNYIDKNIPYLDIMIILNNNDKFNFHILSDYPFKPPKNIFINNKNYNDFLKIYSQKTLIELKTYINFDCLCCYSITCSSNWSPPLRLINMINEYYNFKKTRKNIINKLLANKIINKFLKIDDKGFHEYFYHFLV
jgi:ubiquitin-protein ligase